MAGTVRKRTWTTRKGETKAAWQAVYFDQNRKRHARQFTTRPAADTWLTRTNGDVAAGIHTPDANSITVKEAAQLWLTRRESKRLERGSLRTYHGYVTHIVPLIGHRSCRGSPPRWSRPSPTCWATRELAPAPARC